jgi:glycosyltransferase involved in cell wall biosynthesis
VVSLVRKNQEKVLEDLPKIFTELELPISILVPAFNEEATIVASVQSMLQLQYSDYEIIVINDGSRDATLDVLIQAFDLVNFPVTSAGTIPTKKVQQVYRSTHYANLRIIDKVNGGKADSLNAGINIARHPLFCAVDADSILDRMGLQKLVTPFLRKPDMVVTGGTIRVANGCQVKNGYLTHVGLPSNPWALLQVVEYLRAFLFGRLGWSQFNAMLIISGAFGLFKTQTVIEVGGYKTQTIGEDMELVVRLHRTLRQQGRACLIEFVVDSVCWTEVPEDMTTLRNQRIRWQRGLCESLTSNWGLMLSRNGGAPGWIAFPFMVVFEWLGPLVELGGYIFMGVAVFYGAVSWTAFMVFLHVAISLGILLSVMGLMLEEISFHIYQKPWHLAVLGLVAVLENFGYRQLNTYWRLLGLYRWAVNKESHWGAMRRKGSWQKK